MSLFFYLCFCELLCSCSQPEYSVKYSHQVVLVLEMRHFLASCRLDVNWSLTQKHACSPTTFFRIPLAHAFLNGLVMGFWKVVSRDDKTNSSFTCGADVRLSAEAKEKIAANVERMAPTSAFSSTFKNILTCAPRLLLTKGRGLRVW